MSSGEGQRAEVYHVRRAWPEKRHRKHSRPSSGDTGALRLNRQRIWGQGQRECLIIKQFCSKYGLVDPYQGAPELLSLSSHDESDLVRISKSPLSIGWAVLWELCCSFPSGQFPPFLFVKMLSISPVLPGFQGGCRVTAERTAQSREHKYKMGTEVPSF
jgi:hypothetical protein